MAGPSRTMRVAIGRALEVLGNGYHLQASGRRRFRQDLILLALCTPVLLGVVYLLRKAVVR